jgi:hypothetical protein
VPSCVQFLPPPFGDTVTVYLYKSLLLHLPAIHSSPFLHMPSPSLDHHPHVRIDLLLDNDAVPT